MRWLLVLAIVAAGCSSPATVIPVNMTLDSPSTRFFDGEPMPARHTCDGDGIAPALSWGPLPDGATHSAVSMIDPDTAHGDFVHWLWWDLPAATTFTGENFRPELAGAVRGRTSTGGLDYVPACPPKTDTPHRYVFTVYALDGPLGLAEGSSRAAFDKGVVSHALGKASLVVTYAR